MNRQVTGGPASRRPVRRRALRASRITLLACVFLTPLLAGAGAAAERGTEAGKEGGPEPLDFAVVVDQSASLSEKDLAREVEAAALISQGEISGRSRAMVIGFGSAEKAGQSAVDEVCELTVADAAGRQELSRCVQKLAHPDRKRTGPGTDFPAALRQATSRLAGDRKAAGATKPKVVFLLTDGRLDVADSPNYGQSRDPETRQKYGRKALAEELRRARAEKVQIWPLGFGDRDAIDGRALRKMAAGGYRNGCGELLDTTPRMRVVEGSEQLERALQRTFAKARCAGVAEGTAGTPPTDLHVTIPPVATDGSITVTKRDPEVRATYYDPENREVPTSGNRYGSHFELSGQRGPVEALRVKNPVPGKWRVHLEAPPGHRAQEATVSAIWQGRLRSLLTMSPSSPSPGEEVVVEAWMQTRNGVAVSDRDQLKGVKASARLQGAGFGPVEAKLRDDGRRGDEKAGDVHFTGRLTIPGNATGMLRLDSEMAAPGVSGDKRPYYTEVVPKGRALKATASVSEDTVHPGGTARGTLDVANRTGSTRTLRLSVEDQGAGRTRVSPSTVRVAAGSSESVPYTLSFGRGAPVGRAGGHLVVADTTDGGRRVDDAPLRVTVEAPPGRWEALWDDWWGAVAVGTPLLGALVVLVLARRRADGEHRDLSGLTLGLRADGVLAAEVSVRRGGGGGVRRSFDFTVDTHGARPGMRASRGTGGSGRAYRLRRDRNGTLRIRTPAGQERTGRLNESLGLGDGLELVVRGRESSGAPSHTKGTRGGTTGAVPEPRAGEGESTPSTTSRGNRPYHPDF